MASRFILLTVYWIDEGEEEVSCSRFREEDFSRQGSRRSGTEETWNSRFYRWDDSYNVCKLYRKCQDFFSLWACFYLFLHHCISVRRHYVISTSSPVRISWAAVIAHFLAQKEIKKDRAALSKADLPPCSSIEPIIEDFAVHCVCVYVCVDSCELGIRIKHE